MLTALGLRDQCQQPYHNWCCVWSSWWNTESYAASHCTQDFELDSVNVFSYPLSTELLPSPPLDSIWVMVIVRRLRGNIIRTALCWIVWHNVHSQQHTFMSSSRSNRLGLSHWDPYAVRRGDCLELYYCNIVEWFWWYWSLISTTNWFPSVLWHCWFSHLACKNCLQNDLLCVELSFYTTVSVKLLA